MAGPELIGSITEGQNTPEGLSMLSVSAMMIRIFVFQYNCLLHSACAVLFELLLRIDFYLKFLLRIDFNLKGWFLYLCLKDIRAIRRLLGVRISH